MFDSLSFLNNREPISSLSPETAEWHNTILPPVCSPLSFSFHSPSSRRFIQSHPRTHIPVARTQRNHLLLVWWMYLGEAGVARVPTTNCWTKRYMFLKTTPVLTFYMLQLFATYLTSNISAWATSDGFSNFMLIKYGWMLYRVFCRAESSIWQPFLLGLKARVPPSRGRGLAATERPPVASPLVAVGSSKLA